MKASVRSFDQSLDHCGVGCPRWVVHRTSIVGLLSASILLSIRAGFCIISPARDESPLHCLPRFSMLTAATTPSSPVPGSCNCCQYSPYSTHMRFCGQYVPQHLYTLSRLVKKPSHVATRLGSTNSDFNIAYTPCRVNPIRFMWNSINRHRISTNSCRFPHMCVVRR